jgi:enamine deaminase RidA (YjgF/YER057c/UK114 family)
VADWRDLDACEAAYGRHFSNPHPSRSTVGSWGFPLHFAAVEAELTAVVGKSSGHHYAVAPGESGPQALARLGAVLGAAGMTARDVVKVNVTLADLRDWGAFEEAFTEFFRPPYPARSVSIAPLCDPRMRVEIESIAVAGGGQPIEARGLFRPPGAASAAMLAGRHLFLSAQSGLDERGRLVPGVDAQARAAWRRIHALLEAAGMEPGDVVRTNNWLTDWRSYRAFNAGYGECVRPPYAPRATVVGSMIEPHALMQIEATAHRDARNATVLEAHTQEPDT